MADQGHGKIAVTRKYYTQSGRAHIKRKLSGEIEESTVKREKKSSKAIPSMDMGELARALKEVILGDEFSEILALKFKKVCDDRIDEKTGEIMSELKTVTEEQSKQRASIENVENKIDNLEQEKRLSNLLVRGIQADGNNIRQACITTLNKELKTHLKTADIIYAIPIGTKENRQAKLAFSDIKTREEVYAARSKLKGKNIWITEDLTPKKASLYYQARQSVKKGLGVLTWTHNGKIFVKVSVNAKPKLVNCEDDLPKPRPPTPTQNTAGQSG